MSADLDTPVSVLEGIREAVGDKAEINMLAEVISRMMKNWKRELLIGEKASRVTDGQIVSFNERLWILPINRIL